MFCARCGQEIDDDSRFCRHCGAAQTDAPVSKSLGARDKVDDPTSPCQASSSAQTNPAWFIVPVVLLLVVLAAVGLKPDTPAEAPTNVTELDPAAIVNDAVAVDTALAADAAPTKPVSNWSYHTSEDAVRGKTTYFADVSSSNQIQQGPPYGSSGLKLQLRKSPAYGIDAILILDSGQIVCRSYEGCSATYSIDGGRPQRINLNTPADYSSDAVFIEGARGFINKLKKAKRLVVELDIYQAGRPQFEFSVEGLDWKHS